MTASIASCQTRTPAAEIKHAGGAAMLRVGGALYGIAMLLGAFLLFQVQLILGKYLLPWFGGGPSVWTACMLVFQIMLLAGYLYAHLLSRVALGMQTRVHLLLLLLSFSLMAASAFFWPSPITPGNSWRPGGGSPPIWQIVRLLITGAGFPFVLLATTSPLLQEWFARTQGRGPYRLYALSNIGSLLGLLAFPFLLEPNFTLHDQAWLWSAGYLLYVSICAICALRVSRACADADGGPAPMAPKPIADEPRPGPGRHIFWMLLAACACMMFLATTNMLCQEIAVVPFLWVLPLGLYLLSFVACFDSSRWYRRIVFHPLYFIALLLVLVTKDAIVGQQIVSYSLALLSVAMICHGELVRLKPAARWLTSFYLMIAAGGALAGMFVALIAPRIFPAYWEFQLAAWGCGMLLALALIRDRESWAHRGPAWLPLVIALGTEVAIESITLLSPGLLAFLPPMIHVRAALGLAALLALLPALKKIEPSSRPLWLHGYGMVVLALAGCACVMQARSQVSDSKERFRSFFGAFRVLSNDNGTTLLHGQTVHGAQLHGSGLQAIPTTYFAAETGIGILIQNLLSRPPASESGLRLGIVGLGTGTLAAYGRLQDYFCFYEIDPAIRQISYGPKAMFSFLNDTPAKVSVVLGDARMSLEREAERGDFRRFDVIVLDAFNGDSVPVHLLTKEATQLYLRHLRGPDSVIAFHMSSRILDLGPLMIGLSRALNLDLVIAHTPNGALSYDCRWAFLSPDRSILHFPAMKEHLEPALSADSGVLWTDDYSNLLKLVRKQKWW